MITHFIILKKKQSTKKAHKSRLQATVTSFDGLRVSHIQIINSNF